MGFLADRVALRQVTLRVIWVSSFAISPAVFHVHCHSTITTIRRASGWNQGTCEQSEVLPYIETHFTGVYLHIFSGHLDERFSWIFLRHRADAELVPKFSVTLLPSNAVLRTLTTKFPPKRRLRNVIKILWLCCPPNKSSKVGPNAQLIFSAAYSNNPLPNVQPYVPYIYQKDDRAVPRNFHVSKCLCPLHMNAARGGAVGWDTTLQTGTSRVRFPMVSLEFFLGIIVSVALWPWGRLSL
jgi:hypothetical protein